MSTNELNEKLVDFAAFDIEIQRANRRQPYEPELICDYLMAVRADYRKFGDSDEGFFKAKLVEAIVMAVPVLCKYIYESEQVRANITAAYSAANIRQNEQMKRFKFWQGVAFALACITVFYCAFRTFIWLSPFWPALLNWVDSRL